MFRDAYQSGMFTVFYSCGAKPLALWDIYKKNGYVSKLQDPDIKSTVLEIGGTNVSTTYMVCPKGNQILGIKLPYLVMIVKNLKKYFSFEVTTLDETHTRRRFRMSNFQTTTQILPMSTVMPINLADGWNRVQFNMAEFMERAYQKQFYEVQKLKINANLRIRRIYFANVLLPENKLPIEYRLFVPISSKDKGKKEEAKGKENVAPAPPAQVEANKEEEHAEPRKDDNQDPIPTTGLSESPSKTNIEVKDFGNAPPLADGDDKSPDEVTEGNPEEISVTKKLSTINETEEKTTATEPSLTTGSQVDVEDADAKNAEDLATVETTAAPTEEVETVPNEAQTEGNTEPVADAAAEVAVEVTTDSIA